MQNISISDEFADKWPEVMLGCLECGVTVEENNSLLWNRIVQISNELRTQIQIVDVSSIPAIAASRKVYRTFGKDPARYRLSAEALIRRILKGNELYQVNNVVDIVNLVSLKSGFSIGGYDADKINGEVNLSVGTIDDVYEGIGRGVLNIDCLPVLRDYSGAFGSPTSDSIRTCVDLSTKRFLMVIFGFGDFENLQSTLRFSEEILVEFANAHSVTTKIISHG